MKTLTWLAIILISSLLLFDFWFAILLLASSHIVPSDTRFYVLITGVCLVFVLIALFDLKNKLNK
jgi:hypothetical protein